MPPLLMTPLLKWTLAAVGGAVVIHWAVKEFRRINEELDASRQAVKVPHNERGQTLRRDPASGEYRL